MLGKAGLVPLRCTATDPEVNPERAMVVSAKNVGRTVAEAMEVIKNRIFFDGNVQIILDGSGENKVIDIKELRWKNVFLFFSSVDVSDHDISIVKQVHDLANKQKFKIVWIPMEDQWTDDLRKNFDMVRLKMPWYIVKYFEPSPTSINYIKKEWQFECKPILVVMNKLGQVKNLNALPMIQKGGIKAFPFHNQGN